MNVLLFGTTMLASIVAFNIKSISKGVISSSTARKAMSTSVQRMSVEKFGEILKGQSRGDYQIVDVREKSEFDVASIPGKDVIHLPLSTADVWTQKIIMGTLLEADKPTLCLCHHGVRSMQMASFLVSKAEFTDVYNVEGGIHAYACRVDPSVGTY